MNFPCCLVDDAGQPLLIPHDKRRLGGTHHAARHQCSNKKKNVTASWVGLALLLTSVFSDPSHNNREHDSAVSKSISTFTSPSALYELASFMALEENAEEEGIATFFDTHHRQQPQRAASGNSAAATTSSSSPKAGSSAFHSGAASPHRILGSRVTVRDTLDNGGCLSRPVLAAPKHHKSNNVVVRAQAMSALVDFDGSTTSTSSSSSSTTTSSATTSPNMKAIVASNERHDVSSLSSGGFTGDSSSFSSSDASARMTDSPLDLLPHPSDAQHHHLQQHSPRPMWDQVHVMDLASEIGHEGFLNSTRALLHRGLFPTVYRSFVDSIVVPPTPASSSNASSWCCGACRKWHHTVREACLRCQTPNLHVHKLFLGQLRKEVACDDLLEKIVFATTSGVVPLRVEGHSLPHQQSTNGGATPSTGARRGKGCGSVYVTPADAQRLVPLLHRNVFIDVDWASGREVMYFAYSEQRSWFDEFVSARIMQSGQGRSAHLPNKPVVCELAAGGDASVARTTNASVGYGDHQHQQGRPQQQQQVATAVRYW
ncbi:Hypothetical protein, putative [Bodo saltans]|uniref:RanBP2-type domain-containing protein n=1 Tax=Bodo saltans TaxID=75058 RepID=A0A0S4JEX1_BODSA|nr:Hypothetical protein, putative [Bodo saltans]|eukprot:CUG86930.1 Hypothetical protein, putative [Bodo saltans]